jgi:hypothetical protein
MTPSDSLLELLILVRQCTIQLDKVREDMSDFHKSLFSEELGDIDDNLYQTAGRIAEVILESFD